MGCNQPQKRIPKQVRIIPIVKSELEFIQIGRKMLRTDLMIRTNNRPLEERERAFDRVRMHVAAHPFVSGVVDALVLGLLVFDALVGYKVVGIDGLSIGSMLLDKLVERFGLRRFSTVSRMLPPRSMAPRTMDLFPV